MYRWGWFKTYEHTIFGGIPINQLWLRVANGRVKRPASKRKVKGTRLLKPGFESKKLSISASWQGSTGKAKYHHFLGEIHDVSRHNPWNFLMLLGKIWAKSCKIHENNPCLMMSCLFSPTILRSAWSSPRKNSGFTAHWSDMFWSCWWCCMANLRYPGNKKS